MSLRISAKPALLGALALAGLALAESSSFAEVEQHEHPVPEKLGRVTFPTSCSPAVQQQFERAVALLHSFAYSAAEKAFRDVIKADPHCAMARWGVAMSYFHQLWEPYLAEPDVARGRSELEQAKGMTASERERGFIDALNIIYTKADSVPYHDRANEYTLAMRKLADANPGDVECQVFYALALVGMGSPTDATHENEKKAVAVLEPLFEKYPEHPGIPHYLIHACDNAEMASRGVAAARIYSQIAPSAPHALHMPSHIYTRLGLWDQSIASNLAARKAAHAQGDTGEELHAMDYLTYAYLQLGRESEAASVVEDLSGMTALRAKEFKIGYAASAMPVRYAVERKQWADAARLVPVTGALPQVEALTVWARSLGFARNGDPAAAGKECEKLKRLYEELRSGPDQYWTTQVHLQLNESLAWIAQAEGKHDEAVKLLSDAADEEDAVEKRPVTPGAVIPAREQLGDLLLELNRPKEAAKAFAAALRSAPRRRNALAGAARAAASAGEGVSRP